MKCKKCNSENLELVISGPHYKLICADCLEFQKFLSKTHAKNFVALKRKKEKEKQKCQN